MKAKVNTTCDGSGVCVKRCPAVFAMGSDGRAKVRVDTVPPQAETLCRQAAHECPVHAIEIQEQ